MAFPVTTLKKMITSKSKGVAEERLKRQVTECQGLYPDEGPVEC